MTIKRMRKRRDKEKTHETLSRVNLSMWRTEWLNRKEYDTP